MGKNTFLRFQKVIHSRGSHKECPSFICKPDKSMRLTQVIHGIADSDFDLLSTSER